MSAYLLASSITHFSTAALLYRIRPHTEDKGA